jgi:hypothetical protein
MTYEDTVILSCGVISYIQALPRSDIHQEVSNFNSIFLVYFGIAQEIKIASSIVR